MNRSSHIVHCASRNFYYNVRLLIFRLATDTTLGRGEWWERPVGVIAFSQAQFSGQQPGSVRRILNLFTQTVTEVRSINKLTVCTQEWQHCLNTWNP